MARTTVVAQRSLAGQFSRIATLATETAMAAPAKASPDKTVAEYLAFKDAARLRRKGGLHADVAQVKFDKALAMLEDALASAQRAALAVGGHVAVPIARNVVGLSDAIKKNQASRRQAIARDKEAEEIKLLKSFAQGRKLLELREDLAQAEAAAFAAHLDAPAKKLTIAYAAKHGIKLSQLERDALES